MDFSAARPASAPSLRFRCSNTLSIRNEGTRWGAPSALLATIVQQAAGSTPDGKKKSTTETSRGGTRSNVVVPALCLAGAVPEGKLKNIMELRSPLQWGGCECEMPP